MIVSALRRTSLVLTCLATLASATLVAPRRAAAQDTTATLPATTVNEGISGLSDYLCSDVAYVRLAPGPKDLVDWCFRLWEIQTEAHDSAGALAAADCVDALLDDPAVSFGRAQLLVASGDLLAAGALMEALDAKLGQPGVCAQPSRAAWLQDQRLRLAQSIQRLAEQHSATIRLVNLAADTAVELDGTLVDVATLTEQLNVLPGVHQIVFLRAGRPQYRAELRLAPDERREVDARLPAVASARGELLATRQRAHTAAWVMTGAGTALAITGLALGLTANSTSDEAADYDLGLPGHSLSERARIDDEAGTYAVAANALFAAAALCAGGALASWWLAPFDVSEATATAPVAVTASPDRAMLIWSLRW